MKKLLLSILFASCAQAESQTLEKLEYIPAPTHRRGIFLQVDYQCTDCVPITPAATVTPTAIPTATSTATPQPTVTPTHTATPQATPTATPQATATPNAIITINFPEDTQAIFPNPGIGFQTTRRTKAQVTNPRNIPLAHATFRTCAHQINPSPGVFNWSEFDNFLTAANAQGQTTQLGLIMYDPYDCSAWLRNTLPSVGVYCSTENPNRTYYAPDWNNAQVQGAHRSLIQAFAAKYNNDPRVDSIDVRSIGDYGEWHHSCLRVRATGAAHPMPSEAARRIIIKDYHDYFTNKPLIHILDDIVSRQESVTKIAGWRADCWGGHHEDTLYPGWLTNPDMSQQWQLEQVNLEPCGDMLSTSYMTIARKVDEAIEKHTSLINTKNSLSPSNAAWPEIERLLRKLGYRFVLRKAAISDGITLYIENVGIAPNYQELRVENATLGIAGYIQRILPGETKTLWLPGGIGHVVRFSLNGKTVRTANTAWQNGILIQ